MRCRAVVFSCGVMVAASPVVLAGCSAPSRANQDAATTSALAGPTGSPSTSSAPAAARSGAPLGEMHERLIGTWEPVPPDGEKGEQYRKALAKIDDAIQQAPSPEKRRELLAYRALLAGQGLHITFTETTMNTALPGQKESKTQSYRVVREGWERIEVEYYDEVGCGACKRGSDRWEFADRDTLKLGNGYSTMGITRLKRVSAPPPDRPAVQVALGPDGCPEGMVKIEKGSFTSLEVPPGAGFGGTKPRSLTVQAFCLDRTEVTVAAYRRCVDGGLCQAPPERSGGPRNERFAPERGCNGLEAERDGHPVNCVSWERAALYCKHNGLRLATNAEWEYAARGSGTAAYPWGDAVPADQLCWSGGAQGNAERSGTCPVGSYPGDNSPFGVLGMAGNVREWTSTVVCDDSGKCDEEKHLLRGGWYRSNHAESVEVGSIGRGSPDIEPAFGFRCAWSPTPAR